MEQQIALLEEFVKKASQLPRVQPPTPPPLVSDQPCLKPPEATATPDTEVTATTLPETEVVKKPVHSKAALPIQVSSHTIDTSEPRLYSGNPFGIHLL